MWPIVTGCALASSIRVTIGRWPGLGTMWSDRCPDVYEWLLNEGLKFMPAVNWVERGRFGEGNSLPRYHIVWGTARELTRRMIQSLHDADSGGHLTLLHQHRVTELEHSAGRVSGALAVDERDGTQRRLEAPVLVLATGGLNGSHEQVRANWPANRPRPRSMLNGAHPFADGHMHRFVADHLGGRIVNAGEMWNYAAGFPHPFPHFDGHGLSAIPCKSALWLDHRGRRIGPEPLVTGFDTHWLCRRVSEQARPWTWHLLNWRIAAREFAISGAEHNASIRDRHFPTFIKELLLGNHRLVRQIQRESADFLVDDTLAGLAGQMNQLTRSHDVEPGVLEATVDAFDANFAHKNALFNDDQIRRILHARQLGAGPAAHLQACAPEDAQCQAVHCHPHAADHTQEPGWSAYRPGQSDTGRRGTTDSRLVLRRRSRRLPAVGGANGKRSLEGTFLPGCILTARAAARSICYGN